MHIPNVSQMKHLMNKLKNVKNFVKKEKFLTQKKHLVNQIQLVQKERNSIKKHLLVKIFK